jgi:hypothetical protein
MDALEVFLELASHFGVPGGGEFGELVHGSLRRIRNWMKEAVLMRAEPLGPVRQVVPGGSGGHG